jgi:predicted nucleotidyltransferase
MRLTPEQIEHIHQFAIQIGGPQASVRLFGSRLDDMARGGDIDLLLDIPTPVEQPALLAATLSARVSRFMRGRKVDVVIHAPNLMRQPIHDIVLREGIVL